MSYYTLKTCNKCGGTIPDRCKCDNKESQNEQGR